jgi:glycosyltransferase involved in cell wall biosynthesis
MKKISVITPIYNEEKSLYTYFEAIKDLDYPKENFEIIFVND